MITTHAGDMGALRTAVGWWAILFSGLLISGCSQTDTPSHEVALATVGDRTITAATFRRAYIPRILYLVGDDTAEHRLAVLQEIIDQKIIAMAAELIRLDTATVVQRAIAMAQRQAMTALLFREWVQQRVPEPTEDDLWRAFVRGQTKLLVRHLIAETEPVADSLRALLQSGSADFDQMARQLFKDPRLRDTGGLMGWVSYGDLDLALEDAIYALRPGELSLPIESLYGWHILRVENVRRPGALDRREYAQQRNNLETKVYRRREFRMGTQILNDYMDEQDISFDRDVAEKLWAILRPQLLRQTRSGSVGLPDQTQMTLQDIGIRENNFLDEVLVQFKGASWTVRMFLDRLPEMKPVYRQGNLYIGTAYLIRGELLAREGLERRFDRDPFVLQKVADRRDEVMAHLYLAAIMDTLNLTPAKVRDFFDKHWRQNYHGPDSLRIESFLTDSMPVAKQLMLRLRQGVPFETVSAEASDNGEDDLRWHVEDDTPYPELYQLGLRSKLMVPLGPIKSIDGWRVGRVTDRRRYPLQFEGIKTQVQADLERQISVLSRRQALQALAPDYDVRIDTTRLYGISMDDESSYARRGQ